MAHPPRPVGATCIVIDAGALVRGAPEVVWAADESTDEWTDALVRRILDDYGAFDAAPAPAAGYDIAFIWGACCSGPPALFSAASEPKEHLVFAAAYDAAMLGGATLRHVPHSLLWRLRVPTWMVQTLAGGAPVLAAGTRYTKALAHEVRLHFIFDAPPPGADLGTIATLAWVRKWSTVTLAPPAAAAAGGAPRPAWDVAAVASRVVYGMSYDVTTTMARVLAVLQRRDGLARLDAVALACAGGLAGVPRAVSPAVTAAAAAAVAALAPVAAAVSVVNAAYALRGASAPPVESDAVLAATVAMAGAAASLWDADASAGSPVAVLHDAIRALAGAYRGAGCDWMACLVEALGAMWAAPPAHTHAECVWAYAGGITRAALWDMVRDRRWGRITRRLLSRKERPRAELRGDLAAEFATAAPPAAWTALARGAPRILAAAPANTQATLEIAFALEGMFTIESVSWRPHTDATTPWGLAFAQVVDPGMREYAGGALVDVARAARASWVLDDLDTTVQAHVASIEAAHRVYHRLRGGVVPGVAHLLTFASVARKLTFPAICTPAHMHATIRARILDGVQAVAAGSPERNRSELERVTGQGIEDGIDDDDLEAEYDDKHLASIGERIVMGRLQRLLNMWLLVAVCEAPKKAVGVRPGASGGAGTRAADVKSTLRGSAVGSRAQSHRGSVDDEDAHTGLALTTRRLGDVSVADTRSQARRPRLTELSATANALAIGRAPVLADLILPSLAFTRVPVVVSQWQYVALLRAWASATGTPRLAELVDAVVTTVLGDPVRHHTVSAEQLGLIVDAIDGAHPYVQVLVRVAFRGVTLTADDGGAAFVDTFTERLGVGPVEGAVLASMPDELRAHVATVSRDAAGASSCAVRGAPVFRGLSFGTWRAALAVCAPPGFHDIVWPHGAMDAWDALRVFLAPATGAHERWRDMHKVVQEELAGAAFGALPCATTPAPTRVAAVEAWVREVRREPRELHEFAMLSQ